MTLAWRRLHAFAALIIVAAGAAAQPAADGVLSLRADAWSGDRDLNARRGIAAASLWGRGKLDTGAAGRFVGNAWLREQTRGETPHGRIRELYWQQGFGPVDVKLGRQMVAWGRADGLNPTDNLSPRDFRLLAPEDGDLRHGNAALKLETAAPLGSVSWLWFPKPASHRIPLQALPGVSYRIEAPRGAQWALRWDGSAGGIDGSLSYFDGNDPMPDLVPGTLSVSGLQVQLRNQRLQVLGADMSLVRDGVVWRAEVAATRTASRGAADFEHKKPQLWLVGGGEWSLPGDTTLGLQGTLRHVRGFGDPDHLAAGPLQELAWRQLALSGQTAATSWGLTWRLARRLNNDTMTLELSGVAIWSAGGGRGNGLLRARADVALDDHWQLLIGGERYVGPQHSLFGQLRSNSAAYLQVRRGF